MARWEEQIKNALDSLVGANPENENEQTSHDTQSSWQNVAVLQFDRPETLKEVKPYVSDESGGGDTTDARLIEAQDPRHDASQGDPANDDAPTGSISDGDGWRLVDDMKSADNDAIASNGDWREVGTGYQGRSHLWVLQAQQGSGQETIYAYLNGDAAK